MNDYKTSNLYLVAFLVYNGEEILEAQGSSRKVFTIKGQPRELINAFQFAPEGDATVMVDPRRFMNIIRSIKAKIDNEGFSS